MVLLTPGTYIERQRKDRVISEFGGYQKRNFIPGFYTFLVTNKQKFGETKSWTKHEKEREERQYRTILSNLIWINR
jgi:hypothetical protein